MIRIIRRTRRRQGGAGRRRQRSHTNNNGLNGPFLTMSLEVEASNRAFAALLLDGSVTAWGDPQWGGHLADSRVLVFFGRPLQFFLWDVTERREF